MSQINDYHSQDFVSRMKNAFELLRKKQLFSGLKGGDSKSQCIPAPIPISRHGKCEFRESLNIKGNFFGLHFWGHEYF